MCSPTASTPGSAPIAFRIAATLRFSSRRIQVSLRQQEIRGQRAVRLDSQIDSLQPDEAVSREAGADESITVIAVWPTINR